MTEQRHISQEGLVGMRNTIDIVLSQMDELLIEMGELCVHSLVEVTLALQTGDFKKAKEVIENDDKIDELEMKIDKICLTILLREQPFARDLRRVIATTKMVTDLERIGDQAADIADIVLLSELQVEYELKRIEKMADKTYKMVKNSIEAFVSRDIELARRTIEADDEVDDLFDEVRMLLIEATVHNKEEQKIVMDLMMVIKYLERIADHATNVAEWVEFGITGVHPSYEN